MQIEGRGGGKKEAKKLLLLTRLSKFPGLNSQRGASSSDRLEASRQPRAIKTEDVQPAGPTRPALFMLM